MNTTQTADLDRPVESYSQKYLQYRPQILAYRKKNKKKLRVYMREYMRVYRNTKSNSEAMKIKTSIRYYLKKPSHNSYLALNALGIPKIDWAHRLGFDTLEDFYEYVRPLEMDHIISVDYIAKNHPRLLPYVHRWYNIDFITSTANKIKGRYVDVDAKRVKLIILKMKLETLAGGSGIKVAYKMDKLIKQINKLTGLK